MAFGNIGAQEFGTYFIGYAKTPTVTELMIRRMFIGEPAGQLHRILDFSTAKTGSLLFRAQRGFPGQPAGCARRLNPLRGQSDESGRRPLLRTVVGNRTAGVTASSLRQQGVELGERAGPAFAGHVRHLVGARPLSRRPAGSCRPRRGIPVGSA